MLDVKSRYNQSGHWLTSGYEGTMCENARFEVIYSKMREILDRETRKEPQQMSMAIRHGGEVSREELDEIAALRAIVLATSTPEPISFTTT